MYSDFPVFEFGNYRLREIDVVRDAQRFLDYIGHEEVSSFIGASSVPQNIEEAFSELQYWAGLFKTGRSYYWAVANEADEIIGTLGFNNISNQHSRAEISYDLDKNYWGKGIMINSVFKIIEFAFQQLGVVRIQATVGTHNLRSIKLLESLSFKQEGTLAKYERLKGKYHDFYMYAIVRDV